MKKLLLMCAAAVLLFSCDNFKSEDSTKEKKVKISDELEVYYTGEATKEEAKALGDYIEEENLTESGKVQLSKEDDEYMVSLVYDEDKYNDNKEAYLFTFSKYSSQISKEVFDGEPVKVILADENFEEVEEVVPMKKEKITKASNVYFKGKITKEEAQKLGQYLVNLKYFDEENNRDVILTQGKGEYIVRFIVSREKYKQNREEVDQTFKVYQHMISTYAFGGQKATLILTDTKFKDIGEVGELTSQEKAQINNYLDQLQNPDLYTDSTSTYTDTTAAYNQDTTYRQY